MREIQNTAELRSFNRKKIIDYLRTHETSTKRDLARQLDLSYPTVSTICNELIGGGILEQRGSESSSGGRSSLILALNDAGRFLIALDLLHPSRFAASVVNLRGEPIGTAHVEVDRGTSLEEAVESLYVTAMRMLDGLGRDISSVIGVGVAAPGIFNRSNGKIINSTISIFEERSVGSMLSARFGLPVHVEKESNLLVTAASLQGKNGARLGDVVYLYIDEGVGVGVISGGSLVTGSRGLGGEIEHLPIGRRGYECYCGNTGCVEQELIRRGFLRKYAEALGTAPDFSDREWDGFLKAAQSGEAAAAAVLDENGRLLGALVSVVINLFDPEVVYVGGIVEDFFEGMRPAAMAEIDRRIVAKAERQVALIADRDYQKMIVAGCCELVLREWRP
jgi:predicted NBD/HSP70 family sugar kinase